MEERGPGPRPDIAPHDSTISRQQSIHTHQTPAFRESGMLPIVGTPPDRLPCIRGSTTTDAVDPKANTVRLVGACLNSQWRHPPMRPRRFLCQDARSERSRIRARRHLPRTNRPQRASSSNHHPCDIHRLCQRRSCKRRPGIVECATKSSPESGRNRNEFLVVSDGSIIALQYGWKRRGQSYRDAPAARPSAVC
jgi:hypothetical protein